MWSSKRLDLQVRRAELIARSRDLRQRLADESGALQRSFELADRVRRGFHWMRAHPQWLAALVVLPVLLRPRRALGWAVKMWAGWRAWQRLHALLAPARRLH